MIGRQGDLPETWVVHSASPAATATSLTRFIIASWSWSSEFISRVKVLLQRGHPVASMDAPVALAVSDAGISGVMPFGSPRIPVSRITTWRWFSAMRFLS